jgi:hypothetical protein
MYAYCNGDPVNYSDPTGMAAKAPDPYNQSDLFFPPKPPEPFSLWGQPANYWKAIFALLFIDDILTDVRTLWGKDVMYSFAQTIADRINMYTQNGESESTLFSFLHKVGVAIVESQGLNFDWGKIANESLAAGFATAFVAGILALPSGAFDVVAIGKGFLSGAIANIIRSIISELTKKKGPPTI